jgi:CheY-like chemotaxis protein
MDRVSSVLEVAAGQKKLIFACVVDTKLHDWLWMDSLRMSQVLLNLGGNAIKFTGGNNRQGRIAMRLLVEDEQADNLRLRFVVEDNGIGMSEESCRHVFDPFSQAENSTSRRFGGTGLGLAISQRLVTLMGGEIGVMSRPDEGSTFWVRVTAKKATPRKDADVPLFGFEQTRLSILVVDDNETNLLVASRIMENLGHKAATANNGEEALAMLEKQRFDLVLMDCHMPVMDGFEATRRLREREERLGLSHHYVFAMTAGVLPEEQKRCFAAGMDDFMPKPLRLGKVAAQLAHWQPAVVGRSKVAAGHHDGLTK